MWLICKGLISLALVLAASGGAWAIREVPMYDAETFLGKAWWTGAALLWVGGLLFFGILLWK